MHNFSEINDKFEYLYSGFFCKKISKKVYIPREVYAPLQDNLRLADIIPMYVEGFDLFLHYKGPVTRKMFPFDDVIMIFANVCSVFSELTDTLVWPTVASRPKTALIKRFMGPTWGPSGADRTQLGPMLAPWTLLSGQLYIWLSLNWCISLICMGDFIFNWCNYTSFTTHSL